MQAPSLTLGIEEEYQIIDPETRELKSYITEILSGDSMMVAELKPELHQSMVEIGSRVCKTPQEVREELVRLRGMVMDLAGKNGLVIAAAEIIDRCEKAARVSIVGVQEALVQMHRPAGGSGAVNPG